ncbi:SDR family NAD(P)-dependent oxidoreductase [Kurthia sibirica]|uniref:3-oxoacyl-ACP reductase n=1 Tax=Kurthia sibirica TaxID=202750 RepID=A0A2U3AN44_9BACL|nr:SDR family oxidoreductase [Kurthia sibirica]PWI25952.1 hypothetical protein DEX24_05315 [Kurthia sibirica]GEK35157.1 3-oxoacyl-ACP reductase [Kurthia sibirica]
MTNKHHVILVTGGAERIGKAIVKQLAKDNYKIAIHYFKSSTAAELLKKELQAIGIVCATFQADISKYDEVLMLKKQINTQLGPVSGIVNNAGFAEFKSFFDYAPNDWQREITINLNGIINIAHIFLPTMIDAKFGKFISIIGDSTRTGHRTLIIPAAARGGVIGFTKSLALELGPHNIQCNIVSLGLIDENTLQLDAPTLAARAKSHPAQRIGKVTDITGIIQFLLSDSSEWILGQIISINGGKSMMS